jgi:hypothetical protein
MLIATADVSHHCQNERRRLESPCAPPERTTNTSSFRKPVSEKSTIPRKFTSMEGDREQSAGMAVIREQSVNPWSVTGEVGEDGKVKPINYNKLVEQFGTKLIDEALLERFERVTGHKPHRFLRRQIVFSHRDLEVILDRCGCGSHENQANWARFEKQEPFFIYTGRGPSSSIMHIGHMIPFELTKFLSDVFQVPVIIMLTDGMARYYQLRIIRFAYAVQMKSTLSVNRVAA